MTLGLKPGLAFALHCARSGGVSDCEVKQYGAVQFLRWDLGLWDKAWAQ